MHILIRLYFPLVKYFVSVAVCVSWHHEASLTSADTIAVFDGIFNFKTFTFFGDDVIFV